MKHCNRTLDFGFDPIENTQLWRALQKAPPSDLVWIARPDGVVIVPCEVDLLDD